MVHSINFFKTTTLQCNSSQLPNNNRVPATMLKDIDIFRDSYSLLLHGFMASVIILIS